MYSNMCKTSVALVISFLCSSWAMEAWEGHFYPSAEIYQTGYEVTDHSEYDTTALIAAEERTQSLYNKKDEQQVEEEREEEREKETEEEEEDKEEDRNITSSTTITTSTTTEATSEEQVVTDQEMEKNMMLPSVYAPQAKMYMKDDTLLDKEREDKQIPQEVEEPRVVNRFSLKRLNGASLTPTYEREDHNSVYHNHHHEVIPSSSKTPLVEEEPVTETSEEITTLVATSTTHKQPKRIAADAKSLGYLIKDLYLRTPLAALVDTHPAALKQSRALWENAVSPNSTLSIVLVPFNSTGVGEIAYARGGRGFRAALRAVKPAAPGKLTGAGFNENGGGAVFYGVLRAAQLVPYDSAIFLCTDRSPGDPDLAQLAATTLIRKRIRLYALWFGAVTEPTYDGQMYEAEGHGNTETLLAEAALRSGGEWIIVRGEPVVSAQLSSEELMADQPEGDIATLAVRKHLRGKQAVAISVDDSVTSLQIEIQGPISEVRLRTPNDATIDLLNSTSVATFSEDSRVVKSTRTELSARIGVPANQQPGEWALLTNQEPGSGEYNLTVRADSGIGFEAAVNKDDGNTDGPVLRLRIRGPLDSIGGVSIVDATGREITNLPYKTKANSISTKGELRDDELTLPAEKVPDSDFYVRLMGKNENGGDITRLSYVTQSQVQLASPTLIEVGENTQLVLSPGATGQVQFEVTNQRREPVLYYFSCSDEMSFLKSIYPHQMLLAPDQTANVVIHLNVRSGVTSGTTDRLTFNAQGRELTTKTAYLQVSEYGTSEDTTLPYLTYTYGKRCEGKIGHQYCSGAIWTLQITAQDYETGLLRLRSVPKGLVVRENYAAGTKDPVTAFYSASCCNPKVVITATDLAGNQRSYTVDVSDIYLDGASIALIVVGILFLIALIVIIVLIVQACLKKKRGNRNLPVYGGDRSRI